MDLSSLADSISRTVIACMVLVAVVLIVLGLGRAWVGRRQVQVIIEDIGPIEGLPGSLVAGLSPMLRQYVRRALTRQSQGAVQSYLDTLEEDRQARLLECLQSTKIDVVPTELQATATDPLAALSAGVSAIAPPEAASWVAMLGAILPYQRGSVVRAFATLDEAGGREQVELTLEVAQIGHEADSVTSFSAEMGPAPNDIARAMSARSALRGLLEPASAWIATRLVVQYLDRSRRRPRPRLDLRRRQRRLRHQELAGKRKQLAGQMSLYAIRRQEKYAMGFAEQALEDLSGAERLLPLYFRPLSTQGHVHELVGWSHRAVGDAPREHAAFRAAVKAYGRAEAILDQAHVEGDAGAAAATRAEIEVRRLKCQFLSGDMAQSTLARQALQRWAEPAGVPSRSLSRMLYNAACSMAVATDERKTESESASLLERRAWYLLGRSLLVGGTAAPWGRVQADVELQNLDSDLLTRFLTELSLRSSSHSRLPDVEASAQTDRVMKELGLVPPQ